MHDCEVKVELGAKSDVEEIMHARLRSQDSGRAIKMQMQPLMIARF